MLKAHKIWLALALLFTGAPLFGQYQFSGQLNDSTPGVPVYLSWIKDYRKISGVYPDQVIQMTSSDSLGAFKFEGDGLAAVNQIYRIHTDGCDSSVNHFIKQCDSGQSIAFLATNKDTIYFPLSGNDEVFCAITSTNDKTDALLAVDLVREDLEFELNGYPTKNAIEIQARSMFQKLQALGVALEEPLAEIYIYDLISERRSSLHPFYLEDLQQNPYYDDLGERLEASYPASTYLELYTNDLKADKAAVVNPQKPWWLYAILGLLMASLLVNFIYLYWRPRSLKRQKDVAVESLTAQEEKILAGIRERKSNKELAQEFFISHSTVKSHINSIYKKLGVSQREELY